MSAIGLHFFFLFEHLRDRERHWPAFLLLVFPSMFSCFGIRSLRGQEVVLGEEESYRMSACGMRCSRV
jgi:hypothetical protein